MKTLISTNPLGAMKYFQGVIIWEDIWWKRKNEKIPWLEKEIRF